MKVIFLDVDGVLNSRAFAHRFYDDEGINVFHNNILNRSSLACLKRIVSQTGAIIVLSSTWRMIETPRKNLVDQLHEFGLDIHSDTPYLGSIRGEDISGWFSEHPEIDVESYVILDDDSDMGEHISHLVQTDFNGWGLVHKHAVQAVAMLNGQPAEE